MPVFEEFGPLRIVLETTAKHFRRSIVVHLGCRWRVVDRSFNRLSKKYSHVLEPAL